MTGSETEVSTLDPSAMAEDTAHPDPIDHARLDASRAELDTELWLGLPATAWVKILTVTALFVALFWPNLRRLWLKTAPFIGEPNWGHAIGVPLIGLYYLFTHREDLRKARIQPLLSFKFTRERLLSVAVMFGAAVVAYFVVPPIVSSAEPYLHVIGIALAAWGLLVLVGDWGLGTLIFGLLVFGYGIWPGQNDFVKDFGMVLTLFGVVLFLCGWRVMSIAWFPIAFLVCAIPWPGLVYSKLASPLQFLAAKVAVGVLGLTGVVSAQVGTKIQISGFGGAVRTLNVAEACAGLRSLMTFISVATAFAFLSARPLWQKILITLSAIPIAIFCNVMRVTGQGLLDHYVSEKLAEGFAHQFVGLVMLLPAIALILIVGWILDHLFIEVAEDDATGQVAKPKSTELVIEVPRRKLTATSGPDGAPATKPTPTVAASDLKVAPEPKVAKAPPAVRSAVQTPAVPSAPATAPEPAVAKAPAPAAKSAPPAPARAVTATAPKTVRATSPGPAPEPKTTSPAEHASAMARATPIAPASPKVAPAVAPASPAAKVAASAAPTPPVTKTAPAVAPPSPTSSPAPVQTSRARPAVTPAPATRTGPVPATSKLPTAPASAAPKTSTQAVTPFRPIPATSKPQTPPAAPTTVDANPPQTPVDPSVRKPAGRKPLSPYSFVPPPPPATVLRSKPHAPKQPADAQSPKPAARPPSTTSPAAPAPASKATEEKP